MDNKGFTLVELLAIIVLLALVSAIGSYAVVNYIQTAKEKFNKVLISNIKTAGELYMEECTNGISTLNCSFIKDNDDEKKITVTLKELADNNFLSTTNNDDEAGNKVLNSENEDISSCEVSITKKIYINYNYKVTYQVFSETTSVNGISCPVAKGSEYK